MQEAGTTRGRLGNARGARLIAVMLVCALLAAGCGARWSTAQSAAIHRDARQTGGSTGSAASSAVDPAAVDQGAAAVDPQQVATEAASSAGPQSAAGSPAATARRPCAAPSDAPGVSPTEITLASISTLSGPIPGLGTSSLDAVRAYVAYRNSTGGVCGRRLTLKSTDDGADNGRYRAALDELSAHALGVMGGLATGDAGGIDVAEATKVPIVSTPISTAFQKVSTVFGMNPPFANVNAVIGKYKYLYDQGVRKAALVYIAADQTRQEVQDKQKPQVLAAGIQVVHEQEVPLSTLSFDSAARAVANSGADYLLFVSDSSQSASMAKSMYDTGYKLKFAEYLTAYGTNFIQLAGPGAEGSTSWIRTLPNEEPGTSAEQNALLSWMARTAPADKVDTFAADSWAASKAFVDALDALPGPISRPALLAQLRSVTSYDAGGLMGPIKLGPKLNNGCVIGMKVVSGKWTRIAPARGFLC